MRSLAAQNRAGWKLGKHMKQSRNRNIVLIIIVLIFVIVLPCLFVYKQYQLNVISKSSNTHNPEATLSQLENDPHAGKKIYQYYCKTCHAAQPVVNVGAPIIGDAKSWAPYLSKNIDNLVLQVDQGIGNMPARGGCFECSDEQLKQAIIYMLPKEHVKG